MNEDNPQIDPREFDLLVDGELSEEQRRTLLLQMDRQPESWRQLALSFVENQIWQGDLTRIVGEDFAANTVADEPHVATVGDSMKLEKQFSSRIRVRDAVLVFAVMLAMGAGYFLGGNFSENKSPEKLAEKTEWPELVILPNSPSSTKSPHFAIDGENPKIPSDLETIDWADRPPGWSKSLNPALPEDFLNALRKSGLAVKENYELIPVRLEDGRSMFVPVNNVRMKYVGNKIYQ